jgi:RHS repeat-associated protein
MRPHSDTICGGLNLLEERAADGSLLARYTHGHTPIYGIGSVVEVERHVGEATYFQYLVMDHRGTAYKVTDEAGATQIAYTLDAFGRELAAPAGADPNIPNDLVYQTNWLTIKVGGAWYGLSRFRLYDPATGVFLSRDFLRFLNKYRCWSNNPGNQVDRNGLLSSQPPVRDPLRWQEGKGEPSVFEKFDDKPFRGEPTSWVEMSMKWGIQTEQLREQEGRARGEEEARRTARDEAVRRVIDHILDRGVPPYEPWEVEGIPSDVREEVMEEAKRFMEMLDREEARKILEEQEQAERDLNAPFLDPCAACCIYAVERRWHSQYWRPGLYQPLGTWARKITVLNRPDLSQICPTLDPERHPGLGGHYVFGFQLSSVIPGRRCAPQDGDYGSKEGFQGSPDPGAYKGRGKPWHGPGSVGPSG